MDAKTKEIVRIVKKMSRQERNELAELLKSVDDDARPGRDTVAKSLAEDDNRPSYLAAASENEYHRQQEDDPLTGSPRYKDLTE